MRNANKDVAIEKLARAVVFENNGAYSFVTHDGKLVGPHAEREDAEVKAALYLSTWRQMKDDKR